MESLDPEKALHVVRNSVLRLWDVVDDLSKLRPKRLPHFHVTIFGSARIKPEMPDYVEVRRLALELAKIGCRIVTGGGPGLMQAANEGALAADPEAEENSIGIRVELPFEQGVNAFVGQAYEHKTFFSRLHHFIMLSDAFIVVPGGVGTLLEMAMVWQLLQVRKLYNTPLIMVGPMWPGLVEWAASTMVDGNHAMADAIDMTIPRCVESVDDAIRLVRQRHDEWIREK